MAARQPLPHGLITMRYSVILMRCGWTADAYASVGPRLDLNPLDLNPSAALASRKADFDGCRRTARMSATPHAADTPRAAPSGPASPNTMPTGTSIDLIPQSLILQ